MPIKQLVARITPPQVPVDGEGDWYAAEIIVGVKFPPDFRDLISAYGSGAFFQGHLEVFNPLTLRGLARMKQAENFLRSYRSLGFEPLPLLVHPDSPGLLPWGGDGNGNDYCWLTKGKPEKWPVVYLGHGEEGRPRQYRRGITGFLAGYAMDEFKELVPRDDAMTAAMRVFTPRRS
jgi:hypothetical protein